MKANFLKKLFYVPNYLSLPVAGIEISNRSIKYVEFVNKKGSLSIKNFGEVKLALGIVRDGEILNRAALLKALIEVKKKITADFVKISIPEEKTYIFDAQIPKEAKSNIRETMEFKIEESVPLGLGEVLFEYEIVENNVNLKDMVLNVSVIPKKVVFDYAEILNQAGIYPTSFEIESKMIANSVILRNDEKNYIIVDIKEDSTILIAVIEGHVRISSSVSVGESAIRENLLKTGLFKDEADADKFLENDFSFETTYNKESYMSLINIYSILKDEVEKFNDYVVTKFPKIKKIGNIILSGKSSALPGLPKHINQNINAQIILANSLINVFDVNEHVSDMSFSESLCFAAPIGLVISSYRYKNA